MIKAVLPTLLLGVLPFLAGGAEVFRSDFESGLNQWENPESAATAALTTVAASGKQALEARFDPYNPTGKKGNNAVRSIRIPVKKGVYRLTAKVQLAENFGSTLGIEFYNDKNRKVGNNGAYFGSKPASTEAWNDVTVTGYAYSDDTSYALIKLWMPVHLSVPQVLRLDDVRLESVDSSPQPPPWPAQYKIRPNEKAKLTAADFPGPDGIVYPDFSRAGIRPGFHDRKDVKVLKLSDFGAKPNDGKDCYDAIQAAIAALPPEGGVVEFDTGNYRLSRFLTITRDNIVLRGAGKDATKLDLDYDTGDGRVDLYGIKDGDKVAPNQPIHLYARPQKLKQLTLETEDGKVFGKLTLNVHSGNRSYLVARLPKSLKTGRHTIKGIALYQDGSRYEKSVTVRVTPGIEDTLPPYFPNGVIHFRGKGFLEGDYLLAADGKRGESSVVLKDKKHPFRPGDTVILRAPETPRRKAETKNACNWGTYRSTILYVDKVDGAKITFNQPMRIDYPIIDGAFLRGVDLVKGGGFENMTVEQKTDYWSTSVLFEFASDCLARNVKVIKCGRHPVYAYNAKFCSILNCEFDDAWFKGAGGTAYSGWEVSYDCLMDGIETRRLRHAPMVQWSASGNVIRNGVFHSSDAQWHSGWTNENLFENCVITSDTRENGGYGNAFWASAPEDGAHGPNGPRNVVYNCDTYSIAPAIWLGGMNEGWIFAYNRFRVKSGSGLFVKTASFDHILKGNVFQLEDGSPLVTFASPDCGGIELVDNQVYGTKSLYQGLQKPAVNRGNRLMKYDADVPRPKPREPSIYEWQVRNRKK